jgi:uncharacterized protein (TIGR03067 family)
MHAHLLLWLLLALDSPTPSPEVETDLTGTYWVMEFMVVEGEGVNKLKRHWMRFGNGTFTSAQGGTLKWSAGPPKFARVLDFFEARDDRTVYARAIYKIERDRLTLCIARTSRDSRPTRFSGEAGQPQALVVLKRARP